MPSRLSDLLERIRPAGAPGAATEATTQRERDAGEEVDAVRAVVARFAQEAESMIAAAQADAARIRAEGEDHARKIAAQVPDRVAAAGAGAVAEPGPADEAERARIAAVAADRIDGIRAGGRAATRPVVERAIAAIWAMVTAPGGGS